MNKLVSIVASLLLVLTINNVQAQSKITALPLMVIGVPELIIVSLFSCMAITILIVIVKKVTHK
jgi:hypothetical protein